MTDFFRKEILESKLYRVDHIPDGIKLNQNECPWDLPIDLKTRIAERLIKTDWNRYPCDDLIHLQKKIARLHGLAPDQIVVSNGSNTLIQALVCVIPRDQKVMILDPSFVVYEMQVRLNGNPLIKVPLSDDFELLTERTLQTIQKEKPGLIFIANPNAPTGTLFDKQSLHRIIAAASCPVVIDEAYYYFTKETVIDWLSDFSNLVVMRTLSKAMAIGGVRFGYLMADAEIAEQVEKFLMSFRISKITSVIVDEVLDHLSYIESYVEPILKERGRLYAELQKIDDVRVYHSEANFLLLRVPDAAQITQDLTEHGVLVRNIDNGTTLKNCVRVSVGTVDENTALLEAIRQCLAKK